MGRTVKADRYAMHEKWREEEIHRVHDGRQREREDED
jgi:hypothetical protein